MPQPQVFRRPADQYLFTGKYLVFQTIYQTINERQTELLTALAEHLWISAAALAAAVLIAVPLAVWLSSRRKAAEFVLQITNVLQTIPSLALLGLLIPLVGIGIVPTLIALTLYALLPIFQNTYLGLSEIDPSVKEAETAFGLSRWQQLTRVELPIALPAVISGVRTAAVLIIGTATLAALIGAGGLGTVILLGIDRHNMALTFIGAALSALLAVAVSGLVYAFQKSRRKGLFAALTAALLLVPAAFALMPSEKDEIVIAGKLGSEPDILINMYAQLIEAEDAGSKVVLKPNFGKTTFLFNALTSGEIDIYPEFTGTVLESLVALPASEQDKKRGAGETYTLAKALLDEQFGLILLPPMKYQNTYTLALPQAYAERHGLAAISDLAKVKNSVRAGFTLEFTDRDDGYKGLAGRHGIVLAERSAIEPALRYTALAQGKIDLVDAYSTDSEIRQYGLKMLADDLNLFPPYQGAPLMKAEFARSHPQVAAALNRLQGRISEEEMVEMNYRVKSGGEKPADVARDYLLEHGLLDKGRLK